MCVNRKKELCVFLFQVYAASNVELITRTRTDHLSDQNKNKIKGKSLHQDVVTPFLFPYS